MLKRSQTISYHYLIKQLPTATVFIDSKKVILFVSDKWLNDFDLDYSEVQGKHIESLFKNSNLEWKKALSKCLNGPTNVKITESFNHPRNKPKWLELESKHWHDEKENVIGSILQVEDVTKRVLAENKLEKLNLFSEDISDTAEIGFWDYSLQEDKMFWDYRTKSIYEVPADYAPNFIDTLNFFKLGSSRNTISMTINKAISKETAFREKLQIITAKNSEVWVIISGKPIYKKGKFCGLVGTIQNINELHITETKSKENQHLLRTLIDNLPLNVYIKDLESRKILANKAEVEYCNATIESEILGQDDFAIFDQKTAEKARKDDLKVMRDLKPILSQEVLQAKKDGHASNFLISKIPLVDSDGHAYGMVGISLDISDRKKKELELRKLIDVTSSQNEKLINFAHIVSHNLRSHTSNFSMLLDFLCQEDCKVERQKIMDMLIDSSNNLQETLDNLNEVVDINTNRGLRRKPILLKNKIKAIQQSLSADLLTHNAKIINEVGSTTKIKTVPAYIDSILSNFITNAVKYRSPDRDPVIILSAEKEKDYTTLSIADNGLGIDLKKYGDKLFGMYKTFHERPDARGIGLYITKNQIEAMKGKVTVTSKVGVGTTFKIYFNDKN